jgi:hypothetical protein
VALCGAGRSVAISFYRQHWYGQEKKTPLSLNIAAGVPSLMRGERGELGTDVTRAWAWALTRWAVSCRRYWRRGGAWRATAAGAQRAAARRELGSARFTSAALETYLPASTSSHSIAGLYWRTGMPLPV